MDAARALDDEVLPAVLAAFDHRVGARTLRANGVLSTRGFNNGEQPLGFAHIDASSFFAQSRVALNRRALVNSFDQIAIL